MVRKKLTKKKLSLLFGIVAFLFSQLVVVFVPYGSVPTELRPVYDGILKYRNKVVNRLNLPIDLYSTQKTADLAGGKVNIYFAPSKTISKALVDFIKSSKDSLVVCVFELNLPEVVHALADQFKNGVDVRVIVDEDYKNEAEMKVLYDAGVPVRFDDRSAFMHNKFAVADGLRVWTGSYNFTKNGTYKNDNNAISLESEKLAENYLSEFHEMWTHKKGFFSDEGFGPKSAAKTPNAKITFSEFELENYFSPEDIIEPKILREIDAAQKSIHILAFSFTSDPIEDIVKRKMRNGVIVKALFHGSGAKTEYSAYEGLLKDGADCKISFNRRGVMHHKVIIIDSKVVITGSYNFSKNASESNDENILIIRSPHIARIYEEEFQRCMRGIKGY
ncbi:MAG: phospholipase D-like domain-containing protein [Lentisphaeraceae bacterium]|nr:phospholipase D-like domain-containing protein [Lentisphaeraceae bacterium]